MIALVTDSNALLPDSLRGRFAARVVPLTVVVDGQPFAEGVDLTTAACYERLRAGATVSTAAPPPGAFVAAYEAAAADGADAVLSVHIGSNTSATLGSARIAARESRIPVELVDTGTASFPVACCVWAAGTVLEAGGDLDAAAAAARAVAASVGNVFVLGALDLARRGGRLRGDAAADAESGVAVLALRGGTMDVVAHARDAAEAVGEMAAVVERAAADERLLVGVGDAAAGDLATALAGRLAEHPGVDELVRYEVGPSVVVHTGLGTAGAVYFPAALAGTGR
jgi:DegV family protein with EDD domain